MRVLAPACSVKSPLRLGRTASPAPAGRGAHFGVGQLRNEFPPPPRCSWTGSKRCSDLAMSEHARPWGRERVGGGFRTSRGPKGPLPCPWMRKKGHLALAVPARGTLSRIGKEEVRGSDLARSERTAPLPADAGEGAPRAGCPGPRDAEPNCQRGGAVAPTLNGSPRFPVEAQAPVDNHSCGRGVSAPRGARRPRPHRPGIVASRLVGLAMQFPRHAHGTLLDWTGGDG